MSPGEPLDADDLRDRLPDDLVSEGFEGAYRFPDNSRRRVPAVMYVLFGLGCLAAFVFWNDSSALVNGGLAWVGGALVAFGVFSFTSGWRMTVDEKQALVEAQQAIQFPIGHASAQQVWHGLRSRPTWRVLCYSAEDPPTRRGLVLVDAVDGKVVQHLTEDNPERWSGVPSSIVDGR